MTPNTDDPAEMRAKARELLEQADRLDADVPKNLDELSALAKKDPLRLDRMRRAGQLQGFLDGSITRDNSK